MKKLIPIVFLFAAYNTVYALSSGSVVLPGGTINPNSTLNIPVNSLSNNVGYKVTCTITNPNYQTDNVSIQPNFVNALSYSMVQYSLNGTSFNQTAAVTQQTNTFVALGILNTDPHLPATSFSITNLSQSPTDVISVSNCVATPLHGPVNTK